MAMKKKLSMTYSNSSGKGDKEQYSTRNLKGNLLQTVDRTGKGDLPNRVNRYDKADLPPRVNRAEKGDLKQQRVNREAKGDLIKPKAVVRTAEAAPVPVKPKIKPVEVVKTTVSERLTPVKKAAAPKRPTAFEAMNARAASRDVYSGTKTASGLNARPGFKTIKDIFRKKGK